MCCFQCLLYSKSNKSVRDELDSNGKQEIGLSETDRAGGDSLPSLQLPLQQQSVIDGSRGDCQSDVCNESVYLGSFQEQYISWINRFKLSETTGQEEYQCDVCNKSFANSSSLSHHKLVHTNIKMYTCNICNKALTTSYSLSQHKLIHTGIKRHTCNAVSYTHLDVYKRQDGQCAQQQPLKKLFKAKTGSGYKVKLLRFYS